MTSRPWSTKKRGANASSSKLPDAKPCKAHQDTHKTRAKQRGHTCHVRSRCGEVRVQWRHMRVSDEGVT